MNAVATSEEIAETIEEKRGRAAELEDRLEEIESEIEEATSELGEATAAGDSERQDELVDRLRELRAERDGHRSALEVLDEEVGELEERRERLALEEAESRRDELIQEAEDRIDRLAEQALERMRELHGEIQETRSKIEEADRAQKRARDLSDSPGPRHSRAQQRFNQHYPIGRLMAVVDEYAEEHGW